jgi:hypothetical protein
MRSPDHWLWNGVLQTRHGLVFGSVYRSGSGLVWSYVTILSIQVTDRRSVTVGIWAAAIKPLKA